MDTLRVSVGQIAIGSVSSVIERTAMIVQQIVLVLLHTELHREELTHLGTDLGQVLADIDLG